MNQVKVFLVVSVVFFLMNSLPVPPDASAELKAFITNLSPQIMKLLESPTFTTLEADKVKVSTPSHQRCRLLQFAVTHFHYMTPGEIILQDDLTMKGLLARKFSLWEIDGLRPASFSPTTFPFINPDPSNPNYLQEYRKINQTLYDSVPMEEGVYLLALAAEPARFPIVKLVCVYRKASGELYKDIRPIPILPDDWRSTLANVEEIESSKKTWELDLKLTQFKVAIHLYWLMKKELPKTLDDLDSVVGKRNKEAWDEGITWMAEYMLKHFKVEQTRALP